MVGGGQGNIDRRQAGRDSAVGLRCLTVVKTIPPAIDTTGGALDGGEDVTARSRLPHGPLATLPKGKEARWIRRLRCTTDTERW